VKKLYLLAILIFLLTVFLRIYKTEEKFIFHAEYNYKLWPIKEIIYDHKIRLIGIEAVSYLHHLHYPPLALYIFAPILYINRANPISIETSLIFLSGLTAVLILYLGTKILSLRVGLLASLIYAISFFVQRADRFIWVVGPILFFTTLYFLIVDKIFAEEKNNLISFLLLGAVVGLALNFHFQAASLILTTFILSFFYLPFRNALKSQAVFFFGIILFLLPIFVFELRHNFYNLRGIILLFKDSGGLIQSSFLGQVYKSINATSAIPLKIISNDIDAKSVNTISILVVFGLQAAVITWFIKFWKKINKRPQFFFLTFILLWLFGLFSFPFVQNRYYATDYYLYFLIVPVIFVLAYLFETIFSFPKIGLFAGSLILGFFVYHNLLLNSAFIPSTNWREQNKAINYIFENHNKKSLAIKFTDFASEEYAFLFYYKSKIYNFPYESIEFIEPWHENKNYDFIFSSDRRIYPDSKKFGGIVVAKTD